jgi:hypothetical protein
VTEASQAEGNKPEQKPAEPAAPAPASVPAAVPAAADQPEALREDEDAVEAQQALELVARHKERLERMPDGPRPFPPGTSKPTWRRRTYVVDWKLQLSYAGLYIATVTLFVVGFAASNFIFVRLAQGVKLNSRTLPQQTWWQQDDLGFYIVLNVVILLFVGMGMAFWAIIQSHRVAGPALRFRRAFRSMLRRDYDFHMSLRKHDFLKDLAVELNVLNNALKAKDLVVSDAVMRVAALAKTIDDPSKAGELHEIAQELADVVIPPPEPPQADEEPAKA